MTFPNIPNVTPTINIRRNEVINLLLASVAFEELGLAHLLNAEAEKVQAALGTLPGVSLTASSISQLLSVNQNVNRMLNTIIKKEMLLQFKLEEILNISTSSTTTTTTTTTTTSTTTSSTTSTTSTSTTSTTTTTSTTSTTTTTTGVPCNCSGLIITSATGTPTTFANNDVDLVVPVLLSRNINGFISILCDCTTGTVDQADSEFNFKVTPQDNYGFDFSFDTITSVMCENGVMTVMGTGTVSNPQSPPSPAAGSYNFTLVLTENLVGGTITITLTNPSNGMIVFQTVPFAPTNGAGKEVSVTECAS